MHLKRLVAYAQGTGLVNYLRLVGLTFPAKVLNVIYSVKVAVNIFRVLENYSKAFWISVGL